MINLRNLSGSATVSLNDAVNKKLNSGEVVLNLAAGEPDFPTPLTIRQAAIDSLFAGETYYSESQGLAELRNGLAEKLYTRLDSENIAITASGKMAVFTALAATLVPGDFVAIVSPAWPSYAELSYLLSAKTIEIPDASFCDPTLYEEALRLHSPKVVVFSNPCNPTGKLLSKEQLEIITEISARHAVTLIVDEIYSGLVTDEFYSAANFISESHNDLVVVNGFSKAYAMTGWRLGYTVSNLRRAAAHTKVIQNTSSCSPVFVQRAASAALELGDSERISMASTYNKRAIEFHSFINRPSSPLMCEVPSGAFYMWVKLPHGVDSVSFASTLLNSRNIAVVPGVHFGKNGEGFIRVSLTNPINDLLKAAAALIVVAEDEKRKNCAFQ